MSKKYEKPSAKNERDEMDKNNSSDPENVTSGSDPAPSKGGTSASSDHASERELIYLKDPIGRKFQFPFKVAKTWHGMESLIEQASHHIDTIGPLIKAGHYDLIGPDGNTILPSVWEPCIEPGWLITMRLWKDAEDARKEAEEVFKKKALDEAKLKAEEMLKKDQGKDQLPIRFKDAVGRKFSFPFHQCKTWMGMEELIKQAFVHVDTIGPHVQAGHYDLVGPNGDIILPQLWEKVIEPDWAVTMHMWPMGGSSMPMGHQSMPMGPMFRPRPPGMQYPPFPSRPGVRPPPPPPPPNLPAAQPSGAVREIWQQKKKPSKKMGGVLGFLTDPRPQKKRQRKQEADVVEIEPVATEANIPPIIPFGKAKRPNIDVTRPKSATDSSSELSAGSDDDVTESTYGWSEPTDGTESELGARQEARQKDLIVVCKPRNTSGIHHQAIRRQTFRPLERPMETAKRRLEISSARVYLESQLMFEFSSLELIRRSNASPPTRSQSARSERSHLTWLQITRNFMNFPEFEDIALFELSHEPTSRRLVSHLFHTIKSKKVDEDWYIRPGTVIRCDTDPAEDTFESALFVALPHLHTHPYNGRSPPRKGEGLCRERRLDDAFDQFSTAHLDQEKNWYSRHGLGSDRSQTFWVRQVWLLLVGRNILTYGNVSADTLEAGNITIQDEIVHAEDGDRIIQIVDEERRLFYIPLSKCKSFYELKVTMIHQFMRIGRTDIKEYSLHFHLEGGQEINSGKWWTILKQPSLPLIKVTLCSMESNDDGPPSSRASQSSKKANSDKISLNISEPSRDTDKSSSDEDSGSDTESETHEGESSRSEDLGFLLIDPELMTLNSEHSVPALNRMVPPFFSWLIQKSHLKEGNIANAFREAIARIELMLLRVDKKQDSDGLMEDLTRAFGITNFYDETTTLDYEEFKYRRASLHKGKFPHGSSSISSFSDDSTLVLADEYFDVVLLTLESFISIDFPSKLTQKFFGALADVIKDPTFTLQLQNSDAPDPDIPDTNRHDKKASWVISRKRIRNYDLHERRQAPDDAKCSECDIGTVYSSMESAIAHFRQSHMVDSMTDDNIRPFVFPLATALEERLAEDQSSLLRDGRDTVVSILRKLVSIQDGVTYDNEFREQRGLPHCLLEAIKWIFVYVCGVSRVLYELSWYYKDELCQKDVKNLSAPKIQAQRHILAKIGLKVEDLVRKAERAFTLPTTDTDEDGQGSFLISVGEYYVATRVICNLLRMPIHNNKHVVPMYGALTKKLNSQIIRNPTKRQILSIGVLIDELRLIKDFYEWQRETLYCYDIVINPESYPQGFDHEERKKLFSDHEYGLISWEDKRLEKEIHHISQLLLACDRMVEKVRELTEILKDDQGRAIFIFTTVTIIFLPLSFVATYIGMSGGTTGLDWGGIQALFWEVSGPLTVGILLFCLFVSQKENILNAIPLSLVERMKVWRHWSRREPREWESENEPTEKDISVEEGVGVEEVD